MIFKTIRDLNNDIIANIDKFNNYDVVIGVPRSGMIVASIISVYINKPLVDINSFCDKKVGYAGIMKKHVGWKEKFEDIMDVLVVEDSVNSGKSLMQIRSRLINKFPNIRFKFLGAYVTDNSKKMVDYYFDICEHPRVFEWNYMHNYLLEKACIDIDGVLCEDPTNDQNDDGIRYIDFLKNATLKLMPSQKIGWIVTSRLEKYRSETEAWLNNKGIEYNYLVMMKAESPEKRRILNNHGDFKALFFKNEKDALWFIESNPEQAQIIANNTGKVYCVGDQNVYGLEGKSNRRNTKKNDVKKKMKKMLPANIVIFLHKIRSRKRNEDRKNKKYN